MISISNIWLRISFVIILVLANTIVASATEYPSIEITNDTIWKDQMKLFTGSVVIQPNGNLTLDNTTLIFNNTETNYCGIYVNAATSSAPKVENWLSRTIR